MKYFTRKTLKALIDANTADPSIQTALTEERNKLVVELLKDPEAGTEIVSGSGNGTSFSGQISMTKNERLDMLQYAVETLENGQLPPNHTYARFY